MEKLRIDSTVILNNNVPIPLLGFGVYEIPAGKPTYDAVTAALQTGYRHIDTAHIYGNEADVGKAVLESGIPRKDIFVTTKLWNKDQGYDSVLKAFELSLKELGLDYVDLYLIHFPVEKRRLISWRAMEKIYEQKRARAIGVSNFTVLHLREFLDHSSITPVVNQVELSPFLYQRDLLVFCRKQNIEVEAYSPLTKGTRLKDPALMKLAARHGKTTAQILIRWALEHGLIVLPKSSHSDRIVENADVFDFSINPEDMRTLNSVSENYRTCWDPTDVP